MTPRSWGFKINVKFMGHITITTFQKLATLEGPFFPLKEENWNWSPCPRQWTLLLPHSICLTLAAPVTLCSQPLPAIQG